MVTSTKLDINDIFLYNHSLEIIGKHNSSALNATSISYGATSLSSQAWGWWILQCGTPVLLLVGVIGNLLALLVLLGPRFTSKSYTHYLRALTIFDSLVLVSKVLARLDSLLQVLGQPGLTDWYGHPACKLHNFSEHVCYLMSSWLVLCVTLERFIIVVFPFKKDNICRPRFALLVIMVMFAIISYSQIFRLIIIEKVNGRCTAPDHFLHVYVAMHIYMYQLVLQFLLPCGLILVCNLIIIYKIRQSYQDISNFIDTDNNNTSPTNRRCGLNQRKRSKTTVTLLVLSFTYLITILPLVLLSIIIHVLMTTNPGAARHILMHWGNLRHVLEFISEINYSANFYIYVLSGTQFRLQLKRMCIIRGKNGSSNSMEMRHIRFNKVPNSL